MKKQWFWLALATSMLLLGSCACQQMPDQLGERIDVNLDAEDVTVDTSGVRGKDGDNDVANDDALGHVDDGSDAVPLSFDASLWQQDNSCQGEETYPPANDTFAMPNGQAASDPIKTRADVVQDLGGRLREEEQGFGLFVDPALKPDDPEVFAIYAQPGTDVKIYLYAINNYEDLSSYRLNLTVMVDYEPVQARYVRWNPDRTQQWSDTKETGISFPIRSDVEIIDITLPGELFSERRMHEIALYTQATTTEGGPNGEARRFALYNGGYDRPSRPCAEPRLGTEAVGIERYIIAAERTDHLAALFVGGVESRQALRDVIAVAPGETRQFYLSVYRDDFYEGPNPTVLVPLLNGEPIGPTWWVTQGEDNDSSGWDTIDARKTFEVTFPDEPGIYEVEVASWEDPYQLYRNRNGTRVRGVSNGSGLTEGSNALRFRVVDPDTQ